MINIIFSQEYKNHDTGNHPESIERIKVVNNLINEVYSKHNLIEPTIADKKMIQAMKRGAKATLTGRSSRGTKTEDTFSLKGFTAAVEDASKRCK